MTAPRTDPLLDALIAHLRTGAEAMTAALDAAVAIRDRQATLVAHEQARALDAERKRTNPLTLMKRPAPPTPESAA